MSIYENALYLCHCGKTFPDIERKRRHQEEGCLRKEAQNAGNPRAIYRGSYRRRVRGQNRKER